MSGQISVDIVYASPAMQRLETVSLPVEATLSDALSLCNFLAELPRNQRQNLRFGVWGEVVQEDYRLKDGDRVEVYRPLLIEPKQARRNLADVGLTMRDKPAD